jgi:hypothetical protein
MPERGFQPSFHLALNHIDQVIIELIRVRCPDPRGLERRPGRGLVALPCSRMRLSQVEQDLVRGVLL